MINSNSLLNAKSIFFDRGLNENTEAIGEYSNRELFCQLIGREIKPHAIRFAKNRLQKTLKRLDNRLQKPPTVFAGDPERLEAELSKYAETVKPSSKRVYIDFRESVRQYAPLALTDGCWLKGFGNAAIAHTQSAACLFDLYSRHLNYSPYPNGRNQPYREVLLDQDIELPGINSHAFCTEAGLLDSAFEAPLMRVCLAQFPITYMPEILGYTLAHVFVGSKILGRLKHGTSKSDGIKYNSIAVYLGKLRRTNLRSPVIEATKAFFGQIPETQCPSAWSRLIRGFHLYSVAEQTLVDELEARPKPTYPARDKLVNLLKNMANRAHGHHGDIRIGEKKLDDWFESEPFDAGKFLDALFESDYFDRDDPGNSRFFTQSTAFGGPMFGVFDARQLRLFRECLSTTGADKNTSQPLIRVDNSREQTKNPIRKENSSSVSAPQGTNTVRDLYFKLLNIESNPDVLPSAHQFVSNHLRRSGAALNTIRPVWIRHFEYNHKAFETFITNIHGREMEQYRPFVEPPKLSKEIYIWGIEQFAPTILVDGCWLQNISRGNGDCDSITSRLFRIYADELGAGRSEWNHPNVYRKLLTNLDIRLPEFTSSDFAQRAEFLDAAFDIPVFLLGISQFPSSFLPEIIGLNLAIELSGLGSTYLKLIDELKYWGIDTTIVSLHLSIDNLATGHAAIACEVINFYLDEILRTQGHEEMQNHWKRMWTGYLSLRIVPKRFKKALALSYIKNFIISPAYQRVCNRLSAANQ